MLEKDSPNDPVNLFVNAATAHLHADEQTAITSLRRISSAEHNELRKARGIGIPKRSRATDWIPLAKRASRYMSCSLQLDVFRQDRFVCRYCGKRLVFTPVMRCMSLIYEDFPFHSNWKDRYGHGFYYNHSTTVEHRQPLARLGTSGRNNLITTCFTCNRWKLDSYAEEIGWQELPVSQDSTWDGLTGIYKSLYAMLPVDRLTKTEVTYHLPWLRAVQQAQR